MGKVIVMGEQEKSGEKSAPSGDIRNQSTNLELEVVQRIATLENAVRHLESVNRVEKIEAIAQWFSSVSHLEKDVEQNTQKLSNLGKRHNTELHALEIGLKNEMNKMGKRLEDRINKLDRFAHTAKTIGGVIITSGIVGWLFSHFFHH